MAIRYPPLVKRTLELMKREGLLPTLRKGFQLLVSSVFYGRRRRRQREALERMDGFDARYGTDTSSLVPVPQLALSDEQRATAVLYWPSLQRSVEQMLQAPPIDHRAFTFVDIGSGKGRVLLLASRLPFRRIIGVELSEKLHRVAQQNLRLFPPAEQRCRDLELRCQDAAQFVFPDGNLVLYFFDPFDAVVMEKVLSNLAASLRAQPREVWIIYLHARCRALLDASPLFERVAEYPRVGPRFAAIEYDRCLYRHRPAGA